MMASLTGSEQVSVLPQTEIGGPAPGPEITTTQAIANLAAGGVTVTDGTHTVTGASEINFTSGATVTASGTTADVAITGIQTATVALTSAQILAASVTPVQVIAAPGAGKLISIVETIYSFTAVSARYLGGTSSGLYYGSSTANPADAGDNTVPGSSVSTVTWSGFVSDNLPATSAIENQGVYYTGLAAYTAGNGTMKITVLYVTTAP